MKNEETLDYEVLSELDDLNKRVDELEFVKTYTKRKTHSRFRLAKPIVISLGCVALLLFLLFATDNFVSVESGDFASATTKYTVRRDEVETVVASAKKASQKKHDAVASLDGVPYYDMDVPYKLTCGQIGGMLEGTGKDRYTGKTFTRPSYVSNIHIGDGVSRETAASYMTTLFSKSSTQYKIAALWESEGRVMSKDIPKMGTLYGRYMSAIQPYFYSSKDSFWKVSECVGQYFDVVLTDGTVIPFIVIDENAKEHTNKDTSDSPSAYWPTGKILMPEYNYLFNGCGGNCLELIGENGCVDDFKKFYKLGTDNHIAYYRMYKKKVFQ